MMKPRPAEVADTSQATHDAGDVSPRPWPIPPIPLAILALGFLGIGVGMMWHGFRNLRTNRGLLSEGVAVIGRVVRIEHKQHRNGGVFITYQFADEHGTVHKGIHKVSAFGDALLHAEVGQDVTVLYDAWAPTTHMLDVNNVRPVDAPRRRRPETS
ncbi:DUF3592 domain-containing protein [Comamonas sp. JC664]|nr:DUF3592 domain-containing protein [Comamonas sp. JC664]